MYQPPHFREDRVDIMHDLIRANPFATLVTIEDGGLSANHMPMVLHADQGEFGTLRGHVSRGNPLWKKADASVEALAIFQGVNAYITPSWYASKKEHGRVVPTWNYAVVHAYGSLEFVEDAGRLRAHLEALVGQQESARPVPWAVGDAPDEFIERQMKGIVGFVLPISRIEGKFKVSQNRTASDRTGVSRGLRLEGGENDANAAAMADLVERYGPKD